MIQGFPSLLQKSIKDHLSKLGYRQRFVDEIVEATLVVNYGQDTDVQAFVSSVSVAGAGFDLWGVKSGNKQVNFSLVCQQIYINSLFNFDLHCLISGSNTLAVGQ